MIFFFLGRTTIAIDNRNYSKIISIITDILIYLYMIVNITFYFKFKSSYVLSRMISKFYVDSLLRTVNWYNGKYWVVISYI